MVQWYLSKMPSKNVVINVDVRGQEATPESHTHLDSQLL